MRLPVAPPLQPMDARTEAALPRGEGWQFEPKWDGFRCLAFRDGAEVALQSKAGRPLARYFPDLVEAVAGLAGPRLVLDGELVIPVEGRLSFEQLQLRLHPAESRVRRLVAEHRAMLVVFDLLVDPAGRELAREPLEVRRRALEELARTQLASSPRFLLSPATRERGEAERWLRELREGLDGVMAKRLEAPYDAGGREAMVKVKSYRSADCVVGGFRYGQGTRRLASLLLGLHDERGLLHHVGFCSPGAAERRGLEPRIEELRRGEELGFSGAAPGGPSRWNRGERSTEWVPLRPELVVEVRYDHASGGRFRHATSLLRLRPDKAPRQCTLDQLVPSGRGALSLSSGP